MASNAVPGFLPSVHGLRFANAFPPGPTLTLAGLDPRRAGFGDASAGLCGGMALTARDLWEAGVGAPPDVGPPENGSPRFRSLVRRQVESLDWFRVPLRYLDLQAFRPDPPAGIAALLRREPPRVDALLREWPRIRAEIDSGHPSVVGLIRAAGWSPWNLTRNHQVLAYAYDEAVDRITIRVYDPNHPARDDVTLEVRVAMSAAYAGRPWRERIALRQSTGEALLGFFRQPYPGPRSVRAWR
ncbi:MAG TPA: hypothetical protein VFL03_02385 [Candidatus Limnocylindrales bacterium]|nr:hypothetical protein [Candidatus Limnocylindrales bacterium]